MFNNDKISPHQFTILVLLFSVGTVILHAPAPLTEIAKQDAWIAAILGTCFGIALVSLYVRVGNLFPTLTLDRVNEKIFGKWIGKVINFTFFFWALLTASETTFFVGDFIKTFWMPETPIAALSILFAGIILFAVRVGIEPFSRTMEILFIPFIILLIVLILSILPQANIHNLQPVLEEGMSPVLHASLFFVGIFSTTPVILLMIFPALVNDRKLAIRSFYKGTVVGGIILIIIILLNILVLGSELTSRHIAPSYALAKKINVGNFLTRIEAVIALIWTLTTFIRSALYFYTAVIVFTNLFEIKDYRPFIAPLGTIMIFLTLIIHPNVQKVAQYNKEIWFFYAGTYGLLMPILLLIIAKVRKAVIEK